MTTAGDIARELAMGALRQAFSVYRAVRTEWDTYEKRSAVPAPDKDQDQDPLEGEIQAAQGDILARMSTHARIDPETIARARSAAEGIVRTKHQQEADRAEKAQQEVIT